MNIYVQLTKEFNKGRLRSVVSSGQAVVLHKVAVMSKDGDWILREDDEALSHVLSVLARYGARYRFGAPLDARWMAGCWSSHFEFQYEALRIRTDFFTRPPRISSSDIERLWIEQEGRQIPFLNLKDLVEIKKTNRERDYAVIGELARLMSNVSEQILYSRSARDLMALAEKHSDGIKELAVQRPVLHLISEGIGKLEEGLDAERRILIHANERRLRKYMSAADRWNTVWPLVVKKIANVPLIEAHEIVVKEAENVLPFRVNGENHDD